MHALRLGFHHFHSAAISGISLFDVFCSVIFIELLTTSPRLQQPLQHAAALMPRRTLTLDEDDYAYDYSSAQPPGGEDFSAEAELE